jgi:predicted MFS family arabinose efflux permease
MLHSESGKNTRPVVLLALAVAFSLLGDISIYSILPVYREALGFGPIQVGLLLSANRWVRLLTNQLARAFLERHEVRVIVSTVLFLGALATLVYAAAPPFWIFLAARVLWGICWSFIRHTGVMTSISRGPRERAAGRLGVYDGVVQLGFIVGAAAGAFLFDVLGYGRVFALAAVVSLAGIPLAWSGFRGITEPLRPAEPPGDDRGGRADSLVLSLMLVRSFILACVSVGLIISTLGFTLQERFGDSLQVGTVVLGITTVNGLLIASHFVVSSVGSPFIGRVVDALGRDRSEIVAFSTGALALLAAFRAAASPLLAFAVILFFVATVAGRLSLFSRAGVAGSARFAQLMNASDLGAAVGPIVGWVAIEQFGSPVAVFTLGAVLYGIAALSALIRRSRRSGTT